MGWKRREVLLTALGALVAFCLTVLWAILVFAPEPVSLPPLEHPANTLFLAPEKISSGKAGLQNGEGGSGGHDRRGAAAPCVDFLCVNRARWLLRARSD